MFRKFLASIFVLLMALALPASALAQSYSFSLDKEVVNVFWNADGTLALDYQLTFSNQPGAHAIDYVDMGMPNGDFDLNSANAYANGVPVSVSQSDYQGSGSGFAVVMGSQAIPPGGRGTVHVFVGRITNMLYNDDQDTNYASAVFAPTYFGSQYVV